MNMKKAPNTNKLKYVGAALLEGESVTLIQAARLVLEIKEALGDEICTITRCREVVPAICQKTSGPGYARERALCFLSSGNPPF